MLFGKYINKYYLIFSWVLIIGIIALIFVDLAQLKIPEIYDKIGVSQGSNVFKYIRKRAREEGLDGKKRMYGLMRSKSTKTKYSNYKNIQK